MTLVHLESVEIDGYRSCTGTTFKPHSSLSGIIGINGSGKTNILNALRLLNPFEYLDGRGYRSPQEDLQIPETNIRAIFLVNKRRLYFSLALKIASARGQEEVVSAIEKWNFRDFGREDCWVEIPVFATFDKENISRAMRHWYIAGDQWKKASASPSMIEDILNDNKISRSLRLVSEYRRNIKYYSASQFTDPSRCPSSFELDASGGLETNYYNRNSHHLQFLFDLYDLKKKNIELYREYEEYVSTRMLGLVSRISWKPVKLSSNTVEMKTGGTIKKVRQFKTLVIPKVQIGSSHITFNQLSEGTFKTLALIFYIMTENASCFLIEEPEVCIHHGLLRRILEIIKSHSRVRQIIFTTHSDLVLDAINKDNVFVVDMKRSVTRINQLADWAGKDGMAALEAYLEESGTLGEYWRTGGFTS
jgi:ABC-type cobalamin/Fe3+-siderophores transport system ATPase subunit